MSSLGPRGIRHRLSGILEASKGQTYRLLLLLADPFRVSFHSAIPWVRLRFRQPRLLNIGRVVPTSPSSAIQYFSVAIQQPFNSILDPLGIGGDHIVEHGETKAFLRLENPAEVTAPVARKLQ
jgi:hypothetical protein